MIEIPTKCPSCNSELELVNMQLFCRNKNCSSIISKKIEKFSKTVKIMGLGQKTIEKLNLLSIPEIYELTEEYITNTLGIKLGEKLYKEIEKSKSIPIGVFLTAMSIPLIGKTAGDSLTKVVSSIEEINETKCKQAGLGNKAIENLINWINTEYSVYSSMPIKFSKQSKVVDTPVKLNVVITGKLKDFSSREKAKEFLSQYGIKVINSLSSNVNYLVSDVETSTSSKYKKAIELNIPIVTLEQLINNIIKEK